MGVPSFWFCQVLKHQSVEHVDHVDLDEAVVRTCEEHFPQWGDAWKDPRASLHIADGAQFVRDAADGTYDVIIQDSSDPFVVDDDGVMKTLPSGVLYEEDHICQLHRILKPNGILNIQVRRVTAGSFTSLYIHSQFDHFVGSLAGRILQCSNVTWRHHHLERKHGSLWLQANQIWKCHDHILSNRTHWNFDGRKRACRVGRLCVHTSTV